MAWIRIDDHFDEHPKFAKIGPLGMSLWVTGLAYCNRNLTDGFIPWSVARNLVNWEYMGPVEDDGRQRIYTVGIACGMAGEDVTCKKIIPLLIDAGLWEEVDGGYQIHDYDQYQPSREKVLAERAANAERQRKFRGRDTGRYSNDDGDHSNNGSNEHRNGVTNDGRNDVSNDPPVPVPDPLINSFPNGKEPPLPPKGGRKQGGPLSGVQLERFERWYAVYPKKRARGEAERAWSKIRPSPDDRLVDAMIAKVEEWAESWEWTKDGGQYVPNPATWLNNKRWTDGPPTQKPPAITVHRGGAKPLRDITDPNEIIPGPRGFTQDQMRRLAELERIHEAS